MKSKKATRRALLTSMLSLLLCVSMLVGSTFAWFTDSVTSTNNIIKSGTLDVVLEYKSDWSDEWAPVDENTKIFEEGVLYEPGYTEVVFLRVSNAGTLALKYLLALNIANDEGSTNVYGEEFKLSDYLQVGTYVQDEYSSGANYADILMPSMFGSRESALQNVELTTLSSAEAKIRDNAPLLPGEETAQVVAIVLTMPETVGNEANTMTGFDAPYVELGVRLYATQYTHEEDSFDNQYDANVDQPNVHEIYNADDFSKAFAEGGQGIIENMNLTGVYAELAEDKSLALNTNNSVIEKQEDKDYLIVNYGDLEITGNGTIKTEFKGSIENWGKLYINNLNIEVLGTKYGFHVKGGEVEINDLTLTAQRGGLNIQAGKVTVNSGSVTTTTPSSDYGIGYLVYAGGTAEVVINGGDFRYEGSYAKHRVLCAQGNATITVYGGTFGKGGKNASSTWLRELEGGEIIIYGGTFQFDPSDFVAEGYEAVKGSDGWWTVSQIAG